MDAAVMDRFVDKITLAPSGCWEWTACVTPDGYGLFHIGGGRLALAHRFVYEHFVRPIPDGLVIDHLCRNRACVNPEHLEPVTARENTLRGESFAARQARQTHCKRGHEFTPENTYVPSSGFRNCVTCKRDRLRAWRQRRRLAEAA